ncbi:exosporium leader peptide [Marininema halotolerans]|uniref:DUF1565 domain-containing protein n=1 Tax=Marininema halotolerans TaxID=1155944 RepID=A0A1I6QMN3_9BACL|nr:exosporium leader peptide [Marininema halotolerans]SFS53696.1 hypothetical protein SAMN05444972_103252 [Marininema halotolerans]
MAVYDTGPVVNTDAGGRIGKRLFVRVENIGDEEPANVRIEVYQVTQPNAKGYAQQIIYAQNEVGLLAFGSSTTSDSGPVFELPVRLPLQVKVFGVRLTTSPDPGGGNNITATVFTIDPQGNVVDFQRALPGEINTATPFCTEPLPVATQIVNVNKAGNDTTGDGSECNPFLTVSAAMASITDATPTKRYAIFIGPGNYTETDTIHLKANVQLIGASTLLTRLSISFDIDDPSWTETGFQNDNRSGFADLSLLTAPLDFNFRTISSFSGKLFFVSVNVSPTMVFTALTTSVNQVNIRDSMLFSGYTQNGINMVMFSSFVSSGNITINSQSDTDAQVNLVGGGINGNININVQSGHIPIDPLNITSFAITENIFNPFPNSGALNVNGVDDIFTRVRITDDSIPIRSRVSIVGSRTSLVRVNDAFGVAYTPDDPADWTDPDPTTVQEALDRIAAKISPV